MLLPPVDKALLKTVLVVDDTRENLTVIGQLLRTHYHVRVANSGPRALEVVLTDPIPDIILLDVMMPEMDGYAVLDALKKSPRTRGIPVIFVTALDGVDDEERGLIAGAVDYVAKPIKPAVLLARVRTHLELKASRDWLADQNAYLDAEVQRRMAENELIKDFSLHALATLAEKRDNETGNHLHRTQAYIEALMDYLKEQPRFRNALGQPHQRQQIAKAAPLHDIGKAGLPDALLRKTGPLSGEERSAMEEHTRIGHAMLGAARAPELRMAADIALTHHERWDGSGYPRGLKGEQIPLVGRIAAVADVFDALTSLRSYKTAWSLANAFSYLHENAGEQFDPACVAAFASGREEIAEIMRTMADADDGTADAA